MGASTDANRRRPKATQASKKAEEPPTRKAKQVAPKGSKAKPPAKAISTKKAPAKKGSPAKKEALVAAIQVKEAKQSRRVVESAVRSIRCIQKNLRDAVKQLNISSLDPHATSLLCREKQVGIVSTFLTSDGHPSLQLFGMPGTGKTAAVKKAISMYGHTTAPSARKQVRSLSVLFLNGYIMQRPADVFTALLRHLAQHRLGRADAERMYNVAPGEAAQIIERYFTNGWGVAGSKVPCCVVVVDEIDKCCESSSRTLFKLVDWLSFPEAHCKLITMANAMQLPERLDAKTRSRLGAGLRVTFPPYTPQELKEILLQRVGHIKDPPVCSPSSVEYITKQVGLHNGDARRLLQISASAAHDVLRNIDSLSEGSPLFIQKAEMTKTEADRELSRIVGAAAIADDYLTTGILSIRHLYSLTRSVLHDRFPDFLASVSAPVVFLVLFLTAKETLKLTQYNGEVGSRVVGGSKASTRTAALLTTLTVDKLYNLTKAVVDTHSDTLLNGAIDAPERELMRSLEEDAGGSVLSSCFGHAAFLAIVELLRQVGFLELAVLDPVSSSEMVVGCALDANRISYPITITMLHPEDDIVLRCERHPLFKVVGGILRHNASV